MYLLFMDAYLGVFVPAHCVGGWGVFMGVVCMFLCVCVCVRNKCRGREREIVGVLFECR